MAAAHPQTALESTDPADSQDQRLTPWHKLTADDYGRILRLRADGCQQSHIAQTLGVSEATISRAVKRLGIDTASLAEHKMKASAAQAADRVVRIMKKGKDLPALKAAETVLTVAGVLPAGAAGGRVQVAIALGGHGRPAIDPTTITIEAAVDDGGGRVGQEGA
jgi:DNA-binding transcriptional regulator LsrR (DeoR family)